MTAETLKPFLTNGDSYVTESHSSASSVRSQRSRIFIAIVASALVVVLVTTLLGLTVWNTIRIANMQTEVENLNRVIEHMQNRLGLTYLDDLNELEKEDENNNNLIDDILPDDDEDDDDIGSEMISGDNYDDDEEDDEDDRDDDDDDDEDYNTYDELIKRVRYSHYEDEDDDDDDDEEYEDKSDATKLKDNDDEDENSNEDTMEHANLYDDFEKFKESKRKHRGERKPRSITTLNSVDGNHESDRSVNHRSPNHMAIVASENIERRRSPLRHYSSRRRKFPMIKSAKTVVPLNALNEIELTKPAAHFHLTHKVPYHRASLRVHTYNGDMYIGKPSWTNERDAIDSFFHVENGVLTVRESGMYYVYAQVCYNNHFPQNGFIIFHGHKPFLQCLSNIYTNGDTVINTCHTSGLIYLKQDEHLHIRDFHADRRAHLEETSNRSYFGLIKI